MHHRRVGLVENRVVHVPTLEKEVAGVVDDRSIRKDVGHLAYGDLTYARANVVVLADVPSWLKGQFSHPKLELTIEFGERARDDLFKLDLRSEALCIDAHRAVCAAASVVCTSSKANGSVATDCRTSRRAAVYSVMAFSACTCADADCRVEANGIVPPKLT
jgi:hypothetical protein